MAAAGPGDPPAVILVGTQLGENVGTAARAMLNFGLTDLRLVRPKCGWPNAKALSAASGATEVLNRLRLFERVEDAAADLQRLYATTARSREIAKPVVSPREAVHEGRSAQAAGERVGFLFGPERTGLSNDELVLADAVLSVPVNPRFFSLNLAQAVLLVAYEWFQSAPALPPRHETPPAGRPATKGEPDQLLAHLVSELDETEFFRTAERRSSLVRTLKLIFARAGLHEPDIHLLRGVIKQLALGDRRRRPPR
jgi:tRNA/rRNA methyltransferase